MSEFLFPLEPPSLPIAGSSQRFPVRRIYCVGRNYADHAREMGVDPTREEPVFFMKPADAVAAPGRLIFPPDTDDLHHEVELVLALRGGGANIPAAQAQAKIFGYAVGIDLTKRDRQGEAKAKGQPWERAKSFEASAPISVIVPADGAGDLSAGAITLSVNGAMRQSADLSEMIWKPAEIIAKLSTIWTLAPGDLIFTGTPEGVGALSFGDQVEARIAGIGGLRIEMGSGA